MFIQCILSYIRDTLWPTPPASGGMGSSPLRSETNAAYLGRKESDREQQGDVRKIRGNTCILLRRAISSAETDGLVFVSTRRRCSSRISSWIQGKEKINFRARNVGRQTYNFYLWTVLDDRLIRLRPRAAALRRSHDLAQLNPRGRSQVSQTFRKEEKKRANCLFTRRCAAICSARDLTIF